jgi:hypothetical protein
MLGVRGRTAIAEDQQFAPGPKALGKGRRCRSDLVTASFCSCLFDPDALRKGLAHSFARVGHVVLNPAPVMLSIVLTAVTLGGDYRDQALVSSHFRNRGKPV